jgi:hypothetical protein
MPDDTPTENRWAILAYPKGAKLEDGGTILASGTGLDFKATDNLVLRVRGRDKHGRYVQAIEVAVPTARDAWR